MSKSKRYMICGAVIVAMAASIALLGFSGTAAVGIVAWLRADV